MRLPPHPNRDVDVLPEPSSSLRDDDNNNNNNNSVSVDEQTGAAGGLILTEAVTFVKEKQLSDKEALNIPESEESEEKDLVDEALEKRPDPLHKLRNEVIVPVTASPKQFRSSLKLLTLAAESANNSDGTLTPPDAAESLTLALSNTINSNSSNGTLPANDTSTADLSSHRLNPLLNAASLPAAFSLSSNSPSHSASNTPKPAFLRRLDQPRVPSRPTDSSQGQAADVDQPSHADHTAAQEGRAACGARQARSSAGQAGGIYHTTVTRHTALHKLR